MNQIKMLYVQSCSGRPKTRLPRNFADFLEHEKGLR